MKLTKMAVDKAEVPQHQDQAFYRDEALKGFALRVTRSGVKSFVVEKLIQSKVRRITLGRYGALTAEQARKEAQKLLGKIATGTDPAAEKKLEKIHRLTLSEAFKDYLDTRKGLAEKTIYDYQRLMETALADWKNKPLLSLTKDKIAQHHHKLGEENGKAFANLAMRLLRAIFNFAKANYETAQGQALITENPVTRLSQTRAWYPVKRRKSVLNAYQLYPWYQAVIALKSKVIRDYLLFLLFTGLRKNEAAKLQWEDIDLKAKTLIVKDPKNHQEHVLPLTDYLCEVLNQRQQHSLNHYIFPGGGKQGFLVEPRKQMHHVAKAIEMSFTLHDLRRTFITVAESLDIPAYALKRLLNHKMDNSDVTAGYIITDVERLRTPMQKINDFILSKCLNNE